MGKNISFGGKKNANTLIIFSGRPKNIEQKKMMEVFIRRLKYVIGWDWYGIYADTKKTIEENREVVRSIFKEVDPHLTLVMGSDAHRVFFGKKLRKKLITNVFYTKFYKKTLRQFFAGSDFVYPSKVELSLDKILLYLGESYGWKK